MHYDVINTHTHILPPRINIYTHTHTRAYKIFWKWKFIIIAVLRVNYFVIINITPDDELYV